MVRAIAVAATTLLGCSLVIEPGDNAGPGSPDAGTGGDATVVSDVCLPLVSAVDSSSAFRFCPEASLLALANATSVEDNVTLTFEPPISVERKAWQLDGDSVGFGSDETGLLAACVDGNALTLELVFASRASQPSGLKHTIFSAGQVSTTLVEVGISATHEIYVGAGSMLTQTAVELTPETLTYVAVVLDGSAGLLYNAQAAVGEQSPFLASEPSSLTLDSPSRISVAGSWTAATPWSGELFFVGLQCTPIPSATIATRGAGTQASPE